MQYRKRKNLQKRDSNGRFVPLTRTELVQRYKNLLKMVDRRNKEIEELKSRLRDATECK